MLNKHFSNISIEDILALKSNGIQEGKSIDFKLELHLDSGTQRKEFAADITSFANTIGGDLIIGVSEEQGIIEGLLGIEVDDKDKLLQRIESILRDLIKPQIIGLDMNFYQVEDDKSILHIRVPQSYVGPHVVNGEKFYGRHNAGKYPLDFVEIKQRFTLSNEVQEKIKYFHLERIMKIKANEGYWDLENGASLLINIVPLQSFSETVFVSALTPQRFKLDTLFGQGAYDPRIQFEGIAGTYKSSYHHINRQGIIEIADKHLVNYQPNGITYCKPIIDRVLQMIPKAFDNLKELGLYGPYVILTSLLDVKDKVFSYNEYSFPPSKLRQNDMVFPPITITNPSDLSEYEEILDELFRNTTGRFTN